MILGKDSPIIKDKKVAICQSLSGTGALRISAEFLSQYNPGVDVYVSDPTWGNHHAIFAKAGLKTHKYRYLTKVPAPFSSFSCQEGDARAGREITSTYPSFGPRFFLIFPDKPFW